MVIPIAITELDARVLHHSPTGGAVEIIGDSRLMKVEDHLITDTEALANRGPPDIDLVSRGSAALGEPEHRSSTFPTP